MDISQRGIDLIVGFEGKYKLQPDGRYKSYLDTLAKPPVWTVYCGLTKGVNKDTCITAEEGERMFAKELAVYEDAVERCVHVPLNQNQFDALTSFVYNCGPSALENSTLLKALNKGKYEQVPAQLLRWTHAGGKEYAGLVTRRKAEGALFMEPVHAELAPTLPESESEPVPAMPQRVEEKPSMTTVQAIKTSPTVTITTIGTIPTLYIWWEKVSGFLSDVIKDAGPQITSTQQDLSPFAPILKMTPVLLVTITLGCLIGAGLRQVMKRKAGTAI